MSRANEKRKPQKKNCLQLSNTLLKTILSTYSTMNRQEIREANRDQFGIVQNFEDPTITLKQLLKRNANGRYAQGTTKRSQNLWDLLEYEPGIEERRGGNRENRAIDYKSAFYVIQLPHCTKAIKIGKASAYSGDGGISRLNDHMVKYGNAKILYIQTFDYQLNVPHMRQLEALFEQRVKAKLRANMLTAIRGKEYFPVESRDRIALSIDQVNEEIEQEEEQARTQARLAQQRRVNFNRDRGQQRQYRNINEL
jgi:hypothetical protein